MDALVIWKHTQRDRETIFSKHKNKVRKMPQLFFVRYSKLIDTKSIRLLGGSESGC